jgi:ABC-type antimicrobial peptide transport system permease subunit
LAGAVRGLVGEIDPQLPVYGVQSMREMLGENLSMRKLASSLMSLFAAAALALAALGIYGVMSYSVSERRREVGLRMALGAQRTGVLSLVVGQAARLIVIGLAIGLGGALALSRVIETMLFGVGGKDALSYVGVGLVLALAGALASLAPAIRASRVQPMEALRTQ